MLRTPLNLQEQKIGDFQIVSVPYGLGARFSLFSPQEVKLFNEKQREVMMLEDGFFHALVDKEGRHQMTDTPRDQREMRDIAKLLFGNVLIGGLGLGLILQYCEKNPAIESVTVIEESQDVVNLIRPIENYRKVELVIIADIFKFLANTQLPFNSGFLDTHLSTKGDMKEYVQRQRSLGERVVKQLYIWQEEVILEEAKRAVVKSK